MSTLELDGILPVDKPQGWTSHDVVARVRRLSGVRKVGHAGTLDPLATGVLLLCLGRATRVVSYLTGKDKEYRARLRLGVATDTFDADGTVVSRSDAIPADLEVIRREVAGFQGEIEQIPPMYSAVKVGGEKLYEIARRGEVIARPSRRVMVHGIEVERLEGSELVLLVVCSKGTYIRTLAEDLGIRLGCGAHISGLRRTRVGDISIASCLSMEKIEEVCKDRSLSAHLFSAERALAHLPEVRLGEEEIRRFCSGAPVSVGEGPDAGTASGEVRVTGSGGFLFGVGARSGGGALRARIVLWHSERDPGGPSERPAPHFEE